MREAADPRPRRSTTWSRDLELYLRELGEPEIPASAIGEQIMRMLHDLDKVAYIRFASVYREFKDLSEFMGQLKELLAEK